MKFWIGGALAVILALSIAGCGGSSGDSATHTQHTASVTSPPRPAISCGEKTCVPTAPTPTAPAGCGFGSGIWEQCEKTASDPAFADLMTRYNIPRGTELAVVSVAQVDWPDSCLGVETPGVVCLQVITPGFRFVLTGPPGTPYAEYHTDLNGHAVFVAEYATYQDVPPAYRPR